MKRLAEKLMRQNQDFVVLNMMFHSMEVIPNASPYVKSRSGRKRFLEKLKAVFADLKKLKVESRTLQEIFDSRSKQED